MKPIHATLAAAALLLAITAPLPAQADPVKEMTSAAKTFLDSLTEEQTPKAQFALDDADRTNWHYFPKVRQGLPLKEMTTHQRQLGYAFLASAMSNRGAVKAMTIMMLEQILYEMSNQNPSRDPELYYFAFFGKPDLDEPWGWRVEGHHLSINFTVHGGKVVSTTPLFFGTNPAIVPEGPQKGLQVLGAEENLARELARSLDAGQRETAVIAEEAPADIITAWERKVSPLEPKGIAASKLRDDQKQLLRRLIEEYIHRARPEFAAADIEKIGEAGPENIHFAWAGGMNPGEGHYYRVQGPTFLLEYDNTQNGANHAHSVWRDFDGDFGADVLKVHYGESHGG